MPTYEIPPYREVAVPDGGRWLIVYHDGDEESTVRREAGGTFRLGPTSGDWVVASSGNRTPTVPVAVLLDE